MCVLVCVSSGGGGGGATGPLVPTVTDVRCNKWVTPGAASKAVDERRFECRAVDDNSCQSRRWRAPTAPLPLSGSSPSCCWCWFVIFARQIQTFQGNERFFILRSDANERRVTRLHSPSRCLCVVLCVGHVRLRFISITKIFKALGKRMWGCRNLEKRSAGFILHVHSGRRSRQNTGGAPLRLLDEDAFSSNGTKAQRSSENHQSSS